MPHARRVHHHVAWHTMEMKSAASLTACLMSCCCSRQSRVLWGLLWYACSGQSTMSNTSPRSSGSLTTEGPCCAGPPLGLLPLGTVSGGLCNASVRRASLACLCLRLRATFLHSQPSPLQLMCLQIWSYGCELAGLPDIAARLPPEGSHKFTCLQTNAATCLIAGPRQRSFAGGPAQGGACGCQRILLGHQTAGQTCCSIFENHCRQVTLRLSHMPVTDLHVTCRRSSSCFAPTPCIGAVKPLCMHLQLSSYLLSLGWPMLAGVHKLAGCSSLPGRLPLPDRL